MEDKDSKDSKFDPFLVPCTRGRFGHVSDDHRRDAEQQGWSQILPAPPSSRAVSNHGAVSRVDRSMPQRPRGIAVRKYAKPLRITAPVPPPPSFADKLTAARTNKIPLPDTRTAEERQVDGRLDRYQQEAASAVQGFLSALIKNE